MQHYLDILKNLDTHLLIGIAGGAVILFILFTLFFANDRKQSSFGRKILDLLVLFGGFALFGAFAFAGFYFGKLTGMGGWAILISLTGFWLVGQLVQKIAARRRNRLITAQYNKDMSK